jgi:hypothetical protein
MNGPQTAVGLIWGPRNTSFVSQAVKNTVSEQERVPFEHRKRQNPKLTLLNPFSTRESLLVNTEIDVLICCG